MKTSIRWNKNVIRLGLAFSTLVPAFSQTAETYYARDTMQTADAPSEEWQLNGEAFRTSAGLNASLAPGASYLYRYLNVYTGAGYAVSATLNLAQSGGNYVIYLQSTPDAVFGLTSGKVHSTGSFYAVAIQEPTFNGSTCTATAALYRVANGAAKILSAAAVPCDKQVTYHAITGLDNTVRLMVDGVEYLHWTDRSPLMGIAGVGGYSMPAANTIASVQIVPQDQVKATATELASYQSYLQARTQAATAPLKAASKLSKGSRTADTCFIDIYTGPDCNDDDTGGWTISDWTPYCGVVGYYSTPDLDPGCWNAPEEEAPLIECALYIFYQPAGFNSDPFNHTYLELSTWINNSPGPWNFIEAGPVDKTTGQLSGSFSNTWLNSLDRGKYFQHAYTNLNSSLEWVTWGDGTVDQCVVNAAVNANESTYPQNTISYGIPYFSDNSNSFTYSLLKKTGVPVPFGIYLDLTVGAPGWGRTTKW